MTSKPHRLEIILESKTKCLHPKYIQEFKIKFMDVIIEDAT